MAQSTVQDRSNHIKFVLVACGLALVSVPALGPSLSGWQPTVGHLARTIAHFIGITGGLMIIYYTDAIRQRTAGSTLERTSTLIEVGTAFFVLVFVGMEAQHSFGVQLWYFADSMYVTQTWWMITLTLVMVLYTLSYRKLVNEIGA